jgi:hypothetical protein
MIPNSRRGSAVFRLRLCRLWLTVGREQVGSAQPNIKNIEYAIRFLNQSSFAEKCYHTKAYLSALASMSPAPSCHLPSISSLRLASLACKLDPPLPSSPCHQGWVRAIRSLKLIFFPPDKESVVIEAIVSGLKIQPPKQQNFLNKPQIINFY